MKSLILTVIGVIFILLANVVVISYESDYNLKKFVIDDKESKDYHKIKAHGSIKTFTIGGHKENIKTNYHNITAAHKKMKTFASVLYP